MDILLGLENQQIDYTAAFVQAPINKYLRGNAMTISHSRKVLEHKEKHLWSQAELL